MEQEQKNSVEALKTALELQADLEKENKKTLRKESIKKEIYDTLNVLSDIRDILSYNELTKKQGTIAYSLILYVSIGAKKLFTFLIKELAL